MLGTVQLYMQGDRHESDDQSFATNGRHIGLYERMWGDELPTLGGGKGWQGGWGEGKRGLQNEIKPSK